MSSVFTVQLSSQHSAIQHVTNIVNTINMRPGSPAPRGSGNPGVESLAVTTAYMYAVLLLQNLRLYNINCMKIFLKM